MNASTAQPANGTGTADFISNLLPAIGQVFFIIFLGFILGTTKVIPVESSKILGRLCGVVLLPAAVFVAMLTLEGGQASWNFLVGILIAKSTVFVLVLGGILAVDRSVFRQGKAAIRAIFCTQSNDFAFGLPIFTVLFAAHPEYSGFLYIVAPISLVVLNPIGFGLMELSRQNSLKNGDSDIDEVEPGAKKKKKQPIIVKVILKVLRDPLVIMTFLGVFGRLIFFATDQTLPTVIQNMLEAVGGAFTPVALFCLGLLCVGKLQLLAPHRLPAISGLTVMKSLILPLLCKLVFSLLYPNDSELGNAAFIYGALPTAPGVFTYCSTYGMRHETVAVAMVVGTLLSAFIMIFFGFVLASVDNPMDGFNASSAATFSATLQEFPAVASIIGAAITMGVGGALQHRMNETRRSLWSFILAAAAVGLVQCVAAFILNINCIDDTNSTTPGGVISSWQQIAVVIRIWAISQHRIFIAAIGFAYCLLYKADGEPKYPTSSNLLSEEQVQENRSRIHHVLYRGHLAAWGIGLVSSLVTAFLAQGQSLCSEFSTTVAWLSMSISVCVLACFVVILIWLNRRRSAGRKSSRREVSVTTDDDDPLSSKLIPNAYPEQLGNHGEGSRTHSLDNVVAESREERDAPSLLQLTEEDIEDTPKTSLNWGVCRLNALLLFHAVATTLAISVTVTTLLANGDRTILDGGDLSLALTTGFLTHISALILFLVYGTALRCNCSNVFQSSSQVAAPVPEIDDESEVAVLAEA